MQFRILDTHTVYRQLLQTDGSAEREAIFTEALVQPFEGMIQVMGYGQSGLDAFATWRMRPDQFAPEHRETMRAALDRLAAADAWNRAANALERGWSAFGAYADRAALDSITFGLMLADLSGASWTHGYTGFGGVPGWIMTVYGTPDDYNLARIEAATVHELHHNLMGAIGRRGGAAVGADNFFAITVGEYMIMEGLAEAFATELYGDAVAGPWVTEFDDAHLETAKAIVREGLERTGFDVVRGYIFGDLDMGMPNVPKVGIPPLTGYALGYRIVRAYTERTGKSVVETSFVPAAEIIAESGFFN